MVKSSSTSTTTTTTTKTTSIIPQQQLPQQQQKLLPLNEDDSVKMDNNSLAPVNNQLFQPHQNLQKQQQNLTISKRWLTFREFRCVSKIPFLTVTCSSCIVPTWRNSHCGNQLLITKKSHELARENFFFCVDGISSNKK
ncbi:hypothetical protein ACTA71_008674 [Dictyostelium dimigraforme]